MALVYYSLEDPRIAAAIEHDHFLSKPSVVCLRYGEASFWVVHAENGQAVFQDSHSGHRKLMKRLGLKWGKQREEEKP